LLIAQTSVNDVQQQLEPVLAADSGLRVVVAALGEILDLEVYRGPLLELRVADRRAYDNLELCRYAQEFDAVCYFNVVDPELCGAMNRREKSNYLFRNRVLASLARADGEAPRVVRDSINRGVKRLTQLRSTRQLCVITQVVTGSELMGVRDVCKRVNAVVASSSTVDRALVGSGGRVVYAPELRATANTDGIPPSTRGAAAAWGEEVAPLSQSIPSSGPLSQRRGVMLRTLFEVLNEPEKVEASQTAFWVNKAESAARYVVRALRPDRAP
jgi:hypothetical protein